MNLIQSMTHLWNSDDPSSEALEQFVGLVEKGVGEYFLPIVPLLHGYHRGNLLAAEVVQDSLYLPLFVRADDGDHLFAPSGLSRPASRTSATARRLRGGSLTA